MEETTNATAMTTGEALINAGFRKRYFFVRKYFIQFYDSEPGLCFSKNFQSVFAVH